jgi:hypothetical protein
VIQYIEVCFEEGMVTGTLLLDLSAAYDSGLLKKILEITKDIHITELIESILENRYFYKKSGGIL